MRLTLFQLSALSLIRRCFARPGGALRLFTGLDLFRNGSGGTLAIFGFVLAVLVVLRMAQARSSAAVALAEVFEVVAYIALPSLFVAWVFRFRDAPAFLSRGERLVFSLCCGHPDFGLFPFLSHYNQKSVITDSSRSNSRTLFRWVFACNFVFLLAHFRITTFPLLRALRALGSRRVRLALTGAVRPLPVLVGVFFRRCNDTEDAGLLRAGLRMLHIHSEGEAGEMLWHLRRTSSSSAWIDGAIREAYEASSHNGAHLP
jgi:hypothetical protein